MTTIQQNSSVYKELRRIRAAIDRECVAWGDVAFLTAHQTEVKEYCPDDAVLWQWAWIPEEEFNERN